MLAVNCYIMYFVTALLAFMFIMSFVIHIVIMLGLDVEGILRTNGNPRLLDKLRGSYNRTSTGDMHTADPVTVGGLLKVFLRELPDGLIPQQFTAQFVSAQES